MTDLRDMNPAERAATVAAQEERVILRALTGEPQEFDDVRRRVEAWLTRNAALHAVERLVARHEIRQQLTKGPSGTSRKLWLPEPEDGAP